MLLNFQKDLQERDTFLSSRCSIPTPWLWKSHIGPKVLGLSVLVLFLTINSNTELHVFENTQIIEKGLATNLFCSICLLEEHCVHPPVTQAHNIYKYKSSVSNVFSALCRASRDFCIWFPFTMTLTHIWWQNVFYFELLYKVKKKNCARKNLISFSTH